jgi:hypothetical protein
MKHLQIFVITLILAILPGFVSGQVKSLADLAAGEVFTSNDGKFSIALPKTIDSRNAVRTAVETGADLGWKLKEGTITIRWVISSDPNFIFTKKDHYKSFFVGLRAGVMGDLRAKTKNEEFIKLGEYQGYQFKFETAEKGKGEVRVFVVGKRYYVLTGQASTSVPGSEEAITRSFDTFKLTEAHAGTVKP